MKSCILECLQWALGFWGAILVLGLLLTAIAALIITTGPATGVVVPLLEALLASALGSVGIKLAVAGGMGTAGSLLGCISTCYYLNTP